MVEDLKEELEAIWKMEIEPYLEEYFFDRCEKLSLGSSQGESLCVKSIKAGDNRLSS